jgi:hypothetical protein
MTPGRGRNADPRVLPHIASQERILRRRFGKDHHR